MNARKASTRLLSFLLAFCMVFGMLPVTALNADAASDTDYLFLATDRHANTSVIGNILTKMEKDLGDGEIDYVGLGGDMVNNTDPYNSSTVLNEVTAVASNLTAANVDLVYASSHDVYCTDDAGIMNKTSGLMYTDDDYYVYGITQDEMGYKDATLAKSAVTAFYTWVNGLSATDNRAIIVLSHLPIHAQRGDNLGAGLWHNALNYAATGSTTGTSVVRNVLFFHGHNHTTEQNKEYFYSVGSKISVESYVEPSDVATVAPSGSNSGSNSANGTEATIYYTYTTAGYLNANGKATLVAIDDSQITLTKYTSSSATVLGTVTRVVSHTHSYESKVTTEATCTTDGVETYTCSCGNHYEKAIAATGHEYDEGVVTTAPSCTEEGVETLTCVKCGATSTNAIEAIDHNYVDGACSVCGEADPDYVAPTTSEPTEESTTETTEGSTEEDTFVPTKLEFDATSAYSVGDTLTFNTIKAIAYTPSYVVKEIEQDDCTIVPSCATHTTCASMEAMMNTVATGENGDYHQVTVTYGDCSETFMFTVGERKDVVGADDTTGVKVSVSTGVIESVTVADSANTNVETTMTEKGLTSYKAYDLTPSASLKPGNYATVSLPVDETWDTETLAVYYVSDDGTEVEEFDCEYADGYVTFKTPHFSTFVVGNSSTLSGSDTDDTVDGTEGVTTYTAEPFTVYKRVSAPESGKQYLIVNSNTGSGYGLDGDTTGYATTAFTGGSEYYTSWDDTTNTGTAFSAGSDVYLTTDGAYLWTVGDGLTFSNGSTVLGTYGRMANSHSLNFGTSRSWTYADGALKTTIEGYVSNYTYRLVGGSTWSISTSSSATVYFYEPVTIYKVTTSTTGTPDVTYSMDITLNGTATQAITASHIFAGDTLQLGATFTPSQPANGTWEITSSNTSVATVDGQGLVTFTGVAGETLIQASYTWTDTNGETKTVSNYVSIVVEQGQYAVTILDKDGADAGEKLSVVGNEAGNTYDLGATVAKVTSNTESTAVDGASVTWNVTSGTDVATIDQNGLLTFAKAAGDVTVTATYTWEVAGTAYTATDTVVVSAAEASYEIQITKDSKEIDNYTFSGFSGTDMAASLGYVLTKTDANGENTLEGDEITGTIKWTSSDATIVEVAQDGSLIAMKEGQVTIGVAYYIGEDIVAYDSITVYVNATDAVTKVQDPDQYPVYPHEGAVRIGKTATAVGDFNESGIAKVELSMTGVPMGAPMDIVVVIDWTGSMDHATTGSENRYDAAVAAARAFVKTIMQSTDGKLNEHRLCLMAFKNDTVGQVKLTATTSSSTSTFVWEQITQDHLDDNYPLDADVDGDGDQDLADQLTELVVAKLTTSTFDTVIGDAKGGTYYSTALGKAYDLLKGTTYPEGEEHKQFCVFMSDGAPTGHYYGVNASTDSEGNVTYTQGSTYGSSDIIKWVSPQNAATSATAVTTTVKDEYYSTIMKEELGVTIFTVGLGLTSGSSGVTGYTSLGNYSYQKLGEAILTNIATTPTANSKVTSYFTSVADSSGTSGMEATFKKIANSILDAATDAVVTDYVKEEYKLILELPTGSKDITDTTATSTNFTIAVKSYELDETTRTRTGEVDDLVLVDLTDSGTMTATYIYENTTVTATVTPTAGQTVTGYAVSGKTDYKLVVTCDADGNITYIETDYFSYDFSTEKFQWSSAKIDTDELVLEYYVYLEDSAATAEANQVDAGVYPTNEKAYVEYKNFNDVKCYQEFPIPQMSWKGAQVSYVFYLVNEAGQPINYYGKTVPLAEAAYVTDVHSYPISWTGDTNKLEATYLASQILPDVYELFDTTAAYTINVYASSDVGTDKFVISGAADKQIDDDDTDTTANNATTYVYNTTHDTVLYNEYGTYTASNVRTGFDFADTTVAFAVVWKNMLHEDSVVIDFGLDVDINVVANDEYDNIIIGGIGMTQPTLIEINEGSSSDPIFTDTSIQAKYGDVTRKDNFTLTYSPDTMEMDGVDTFFYDVKYYYYDETDTLKNGYKYSSVTVIPATTVYYEDSFMTFSGEWTVDGTEASAKQDTDRPGDWSIIVEDANNIYGYDSAYTAMSTYSLDSAHKVSLDATNDAAWASFEFYGTGFDVIGLTSNTTGTLIVDVYDADAYTINNDQTVSGDKVESLIVDTYYGYTRNADGEWVVSPNTPNALYQVPVMKVSGLDYDNYYVRITAVYDSFFAHNGTTTYDLYLDAVRIYDPTGNENDTANEAYVADGEGWPVYEELRNNVISAEGVTVTEDEDGNVIAVNFPGEDTLTNGAIFIDSNNSNNSIANYVSYGPNNELYLAAGQSIAFNVAVNEYVADVQLGMKVANGSSVTYTINGNTYTLNSTTDLYYSIKDFCMNTDNESVTVVITNNTGSSGILSLTNIKVTYKQDPASIPSTTSLLWMDEASAGYALMSLRSTPAYDETEPDATEPETEATEPETEATEPETEATEPETEATEPETEATEPETEATEPETEVTEPETDRVETIVNTVTTIVNKISNALSNLFSKWFR